MSGLTDVGAVATAAADGVVAATPIIAQQVSQAYENAYKSRIESIQEATARLLASPDDPAAIAGFSALFTRLCDDAGFVRATGGIPTNVAFAVTDLALCLNGLALCVKQAEQLAAAK